MQSGVLVYNGPEGYGLPLYLPWVHNLLYHKSISWQALVTISGKDLPHVHANFGWTGAYWWSQPLDVTISAIGF